MRLGILKQHLNIKVNYEDGEQTTNHSVENLDGGCQFFCDRMPFVKPNAKTCNTSIQNAKNQHKTSTPASVLNHFIDFGAWTQLTVCAPFSNNRDGPTFMLVTLLQDSQSIELDNIPVADPTEGLYLHIQPMTHTLFWPATVVEPCQEMH